MKRMIHLLMDDITAFHDEMVERFHNAQGLRDASSLESAIHIPFQSVFGQDLYPTIEEKAARLCYGIIKNHPFVDGNKRTGFHAMLTFLYINEYKLIYDDEDLEETAVKIADGNMEYEELVIWVRNKLHKIEIDI